MEQNFGGHFRGSVNLFGAYPAMLFDTDFSLTKRGFVTNARRRIFFSCEKMMEQSFHLKNVISHSDLEYFCMCKNMHTVSCMTLHE